MSTWTTEATIRTTRRLDDSAVGALGRTVTAAHCAARSGGARGVCLRMDVEAETRTSAYGAALFLLAHQVLTQLDGADLVDLRIVDGGPVPGTESVQHRVPAAH